VPRRDGKSSTTSAEEENPPMQFFFVSFPDSDNPKNINDSDDF
jgi:hypothetical protein